MNSHYYYDDNHNEPYIQENYERLTVTWSVTNLINISCILWYINCSYFLFLIQCQLQCIDLVSKDLYTAILNWHFGFYLPTEILFYMVAVRLKFRWLHSKLHTVLLLAIALVRIILCTPYAPYYPATPYMG